MAIDNEIKGLRGDIQKLADKVDDVRETVGDMRTETAVINERLTTHLTNHGKLSPVMSMFLRAMVGLLTLGAFTLLVLGLREWFSQ